MKHFQLNPKINDHCLATKPKHFPQSHLQVNFTGVWKSGKPESGIGTGIGTGTGSGTGMGTVMGRETYI